MNYLSKECFMFMLDISKIYDTGIDRTKSIVELMYDKEFIQFCIDVCEIDKDKDEKSNEIYYELVNIKNQFS